MRESKWTPQWKGNSIILAIVLTSGLAVSLLSAQYPTTLQSSGEGKAINGVETLLTTRLVNSGDDRVVKKQLTADRIAVEKAAAIVVPDFKNAGYTDQEAVSGLAWAWYELRAGQHAVPLTTRISLRSIQEMAAKQGSVVHPSELDTWGRV